MRKVSAKYHTTLLVDHKPYKGLQVVIQRGEGKKPLVAHWGGIPLRRRMDLPLNDRPYPYWDARTELVQRLLADTCELCGSHTAIEVHHIRALKDLKRYGRSEKPAWVKTMAARHRKTLIVCRSCHKDIHHGRPLKTTPQLEGCMTGEPDDAKVSSPVRRGADGKVPDSVVKVQKGMVTRQRPTRS